MSEKRFEFYSDDYLVGIIDTVTGKKLNHFATIDLLNEQQATIITLKRRLEKINGGYGHLTHRNGLTANEWLIESQERELKKKNEEISDWIEQHSKDIEKISEQQATISDLKDENEQLKEERNYFERKKCEYFNKYNKKHLDNIQLKEENEQLKEQVQILNKCCRHKSSDEYIKQAYADLNRREREKHSQGNATYTAIINQNEVIY